MFGVFPHTMHDKTVPLLRGFDEVYWMPHSRHTEVKESEIRAVDGLYILSSSPIAGTNIVSNPNLAVKFSSLVIRNMKQTPSQKNISVIWAN